MFILGYFLIFSVCFVFIKNIDVIYFNINNDIVCFEAYLKNLELVKYCCENSVYFSVIFLLYKIEMDIFFLFNVFKLFYCIFKDIK